MKISVTLLSSYLYCSRKLFLEKVLQLEEPPKESLVLGSIRHEIYDMINKDEQNIVSSIAKEHTDEHIKSIYRGNYSRKAKETILRNRQRIREIDMDMAQAFTRTWPYLIQEAEERSANLS